MSTHQASAMPSTPFTAEIEKVISGFDLFRIDEVRSVRLEFSIEPEPRHQTLDVYLEFTYPHGDDTYLIVIRLGGATKLTLPELGTYMFELGELEITPIHERMIPGVGYAVQDHLDGMFCYCRDVEITSWRMLEAPSA